MTSQPLVWLITGCSSGLGFALAKYAALQGHRVIATSRNPSKTPNLVSEIESYGGRFLALDVTAPDVEDTVKEAESIYGRIDVLVNNAAYSVLGALEDISISAARDQMEVNFYGPLRIMKAALPGMRTKKSGTIMNISSTQGLCPSPTCALYAASKHALEAVSESLSFEVAPFGIRLLIVEPGPHRTHFSNAESAVYIDPSEPYAKDENPVKARMDQLKGFPGTQLGDADKAAELMFEAVTGEGDIGGLIEKEKFLRVIIGTTSWGRIDMKVKELSRTVEISKSFVGFSDIPESK